MQNKLFPNDFNMYESNANGYFVRLSEINDMIACGALSVDMDKLKEYQFDTRVEYSGSLSREEAMNMYEELLQERR